MIENREARLQTLLPALTLGLATAAFIIAKTGRDALFFQGNGGLLQLPLVYINIGAASLPLAVIFVKTMKVWGARPARVGIVTPSHLHVHSGHFRSSLCQSVVVG
jgi:hypothetical protein